MSSLWPSLLVLLLNMSLASMCLSLFLTLFFRLQKTLPAGRTFVVMDTKQIPQTLQQIFTSTVL